MFRIANILVLFFLFVNVYNGLAQCRPFAMKNKPQLGDYIHDGAFNSVNIKAGQNLRLNKTFYKGQKYRVVVSGVNELVKVDMNVLDLSQNVLFKNVENGVSKVWDFKVEATITLTISITVPYNETNENLSGCVSVLVGFKSTDDLINQYKK